MPKRQKRPLMAEINVVPYIDVMLVLLIIFMITAPLFTQGINVNLPTATATSLSSKQKEPIIVSVDEKGRLYLNIHRNPEAPITPDFLLSRVAAQLLIDKKENNKYRSL